MEVYGRIASVSNRLRYAMDRSGKTQADLYRETGISKATLSRYLSGQFEPKQIAVNKLAIALDVSEMWLWGCDVPMERPADIKKEQPPDYEGLSKNRKALIDYAMSIPDEKAEKFLRLLQSIEEVDL